MQIFQSYLEKFGNTFLVAALVPSLAFASIVLLIFDPIFPQAITRRIYGTENVLIQSGLAVLLLTVILGFTLTSLNTFIYKVFEGYVLIRRLPFLRKSEIRKAKRLKSRIATIQARIKKLEDKKDPKSQRLLGKLRDREYYLLWLYDTNFPHSITEIMPTRFGNILKAAETYSNNRYGIDGVPIWPRLIQVIPENYFSKIDQSSNQLSFLLNCAILGIALATLSFFAALYQYYLSHLVALGTGELLYFIPIILNKEIYQQRAMLYLVGSVLTALVSIVFIRASMLVVNEFGVMIRSAYDLFRMQLLSALNLELPEDMETEQQTWRVISEFIVIGETRGPINLSYLYPSKAAEPTSDS